MKKTAFGGCTLLLMTALAMPSVAQDIKNQNEYDAYMVVFKETDNAKKAALAEKFLTDFKDTVAKTQAYTMAVLGYGQAQNWAKALEWVERLPQYHPTADNGIKKTVYQVGMLASQNLRNGPKTVEYAEKVLVIDPNEINALVTLSASLSQSLPAAEAAKDVQITKALEITKRGLAQPKPQGVPDAQWQPVRVQLHRQNCLLLLNKKQYPEAVAACDDALKTDKKDGGSYYLKGLALKYQVPPLIKKYTDAVDALNAARTADQITRDDLKATMEAQLKMSEDKRDEAIDAFASAVAVGGVAEARGELETLYKAKNNDSLAGLEQLVAQKKTDIGE